VGPHFRRGENARFGSKLIERSVAIRPSGRLDYGWQSTGLIATLKNANRWNACLEPSPRAVAMSGPPFGASLAYADRKRLPGWRAVRIFIGWS